MKAKPDRKRSGIRRQLKRARTRANGFKTQSIGVIRPSRIEFSCGLDDEEALVVGESLDEREKRG
jgi:hypothetical protein